METLAEGKDAELHTLSGVEEDDVQCPTCEVKIKRSDMAKHYKLELERLQQQQQHQSSTTANHVNDVVAASSNAKTGTNGIKQNRQSKSTGEDRRRQPLTVFQKVQRNRQTRQKQRTRKRPTPSPPQQPVPSEAVCPICNKSFPQSEIQVHANQCLRQIGQNSSDEDDDSDEAAEFDWRRQKRLRYEYTTMGHLVKYKPDQLARENDDDEDLNVDEDDTEIYGPTQYRETDVIPVASTADSGDVTNYMRRLISSGDTTTTTTSHSKNANAFSSSDSGTKKNNTSSSTTNTNTTTTSPSTSSSSFKLSKLVTRDPSYDSDFDDDDDEDMRPDAVTASTSRMLLDKNQPKSIQYYEEVIESLKAKLKPYESEMQSKFKCLICLDDYKNPAISVSCWHVYCEQCWLRTLGARKLCPQCSSITTTKDLRRIYL